MNPLFKVERARNDELIPQGLTKKIERRMKYIQGGISRIEKASGLRYPEYYVEPTLPLSSTRSDLGELGIIYSRTIPMNMSKGLRIQVEFSGPLVAFALKSTIEAVVAHEFMHYVELVRRFTRLDISSDEISTSLFESIYSDKDRLFDSKLLLNDKALLRLVNKRFPNGFVDEQLNLKTVKMWIQKKLPQVTVHPESNVVRIPVVTILGTKFDPSVTKRLDEIYGKPSGISQGRRS